MTQLNINFDICETRHGGNTESVAAHHSIVGCKTFLHQRILQSIRQSNGLTCDEIELMLNLSHQTASARISELKAIGKITKNGIRATRSGRKAAILVESSRFSPSILISVMKTKSLPEEP